MKRLRTRAIVIPVVALLASLMTVVPARAASVLYVDLTNTIGADTSCADPGFNDIQSAVDAATAGDTIHICAGTYHLTSTVTIPQTLDMVGDGVGATVIDGDGVVQLFDTSAPILYLGGMALWNGHGQDGGAIHATGEVDVSAASFQQNRAVADGGAIAALLVFVTDTTFASNSAGAGGGAVAVAEQSSFTDSSFWGNEALHGGAIFDPGAGAPNDFAGQVTLSGDVFSGNIAIQGAAIDASFDVHAANSTFVTNGPATTGGAVRSYNAEIVNSTFVDNSATEATLSIPNWLTLTNSIVVADGGTACVAGSTNDGGGSFTTDGSCGLASAESNVSSADLHLLALADNGGPTQTVALDAGSIAIDAGVDPPCPGVDQRGVGRPIGLHCDAGAYEANGLVSISIDYPDITGRTGGTWFYTATGTLSDGSTADVSSRVWWRSSDTSVAEITTGGFATFVGPGRTEISAFVGPYPVEGPITATTGLTVQTVADVVSIAITPTSPAISIGGTQQSTATATYSDASTADVTSSVVWDSSAPAVATIGPSSGLATGVSAGATTISASLGPVSASTGLTVGPLRTAFYVALSPSVPTPGGSCAAPDFNDIQSAVDAAVSDGSIRTVHVCAGTYDLASTVQVPTDLTIEGDGLTTTIIDGGDATGLFDASATVLRVTDLTLRNGAAADGGAIHATGDVELTNTWFEHDTASHDGGAVWAEGDVRLVSGITFEHDSATRDGGAVFAAGSVSGGGWFQDNSAALGGAIAAQSVDVTTALFWANHATADGSAISTSAGATIASVTFMGNGSDAGGTVSAGGPLSLANTIIAADGSTTGSGCSDAVGIDGGGNFSTDASCGFTAAGSHASVPYLDLHLNGLGYEVPVPHGNLLPGSVAIDAGVPGCPANDAAGHPRVGACDAGWFEYLPVTVTVPADIATPATDATGAPVAYGPVTASAYWAWLGTSTPTCDHASGGTFPIGVTTVTCTAKDTWGDWGESSFTVTVTAATTVAPAVTAVSPASGPAAGGTTVTITGTGFAGATSVMFGASAAVSLTVGSDSSITATSPAGTGLVDVTVTTSGGTSSTSSADGFTYDVAAGGVVAGDLVVADPSAFGGGGGLIRVDLVTGAQRTVSSGGSFVEPTGVAIAPDLGIYVADADAFGGGGGIIRVDPVTGAQTTVSSGGTFVDPTGLIYSGGMLYVADKSAFGGGGGVIRVDPVTGAQTTVSSGGGFVDPVGLGRIDANHLTVTDPGSHSVFRVDLTTGAQTALLHPGFATFGRPYGVDAKSGLLVTDGAFVASGGTVPTPSIVDISLLLFGFSPLWQQDSLVALRGIAVGASGDLFVADADVNGGTGAIYWLSSSGGFGIRQVFDHGSFSDPTGVAIAALAPNTPPSASGAHVTTDAGTPVEVTLPASDADFDPLTASIVDQPAHGTLSSISTSLAAITVTYTPDAGFTGADSFTYRVNDGTVDSATATVSIDVAAGGVVAGDLVVADPSAFGGGGGLIRVDLVTGAQRTVSSGGSFVEPTGVAIAPDLGIYVADADAFGGGGGIIRVDPVTGAQTTVSSGGTFVDPTGLIYSGGMLYVADKSAFGGGGGVIRVDPVTGAQTTVSSGGGFVDPVGLGRIDANHLTVTDPGSHSVFRVDLTTGAQTALLHPGFATFGRPYGVDAKSGLLVTDGAFVASGGTVPTPSIVDISLLLFGFSPLWQQDSLVALRGIAVGASGDLFVADADVNGGTGAIYWLSSSGGFGIRQVFDHGSFSDPTGVAIAALAPNTPPSASGAHVTTDAGTPVEVTLPASDADFDPLTASIVDQPAHGTLSSISTSLAAITVTYTPDAGFTGADSFTYRVNDGTVDSATATVSIDVAAVAPTVTRISPASGPTAGGTAVTVTGTGFTGATSVTFGAVAAASFSVGSGSSITATSPAGTATVDVIVTTPGGTSSTSSADKFTYIAPTYAVSATQDGTGNGTISTPFGAGAYDCSAPPPGGCSGVAASGDTLHFQANPSIGSTFAGWSSACTVSDSGRPGITGDICAITVDGPATVTAMFTISDSDGDGVPDAVEATAPNGGDGNHDGTPDATQAEVASLPGLGGTGTPYVTVAASNETSLSNVTTGAAPASTTGLPSGTTVPAGLIGFTVTGFASGSDQTISIWPPSTAGANSYGTYDASTLTWSLLPADRVAIHADHLDIRLTDGGTGDSDGSANGTIVDPGAPCCPSGHHPAGRHRAGRPDGLGDRLVRRDRHLPAGHRTRRGRRAAHRDLPAGIGEPLPDRRHHRHLLCDRWVGQHRHRDLHRHRLARPHGRHDGRRDRLRRLEPRRDRLPQQLLRAVRLGDRRHPHRDTGRRLHLHRLERRLHQRHRHLRRHPRGPSLGHRDVRAAAGPHDHRDHVRHPAADRRRRTVRGRMVGDARCARLRVGGRDRHALGRHRHLLCPRDDGLLHADIDDGRPQASRRQVRAFGRRPDPVHVGAGRPPGRPCGNHDDHRVGRARSVGGRCQLHGRLVGRRGLPRRHHAGRHGDGRRWRRRVVLRGGDGGIVRLGVRHDRQQDPDGHLRSVQQRPHRQHYHRVAHRHRGGDPVRRDLGRPRDPRPGRLGDARRVRKRLLGCHVGVRRRRQERPRVWDDVRGCHPSAGGSGHQRDHAPRAPRRPGVEAELDRHPRCDVRGVSDDRPVRGDVRRAGDPRPRHVRLHRHPRRGLPVHGPGVDPRPGAQVHAHGTHDLRRLDRPADPRHRRGGHAPDRTRRVRHPQLGESTRDLHRLPDDRGGDPVRRDLGRPRDPRPGRLGDARRVRKRLLGCHVGVRRRRQERPRVWDDVRGCHPSAGGSGHQRDHAPRAPRRPGVEAELDRHPRCDVRGVSDDRPVRGDVRRAGDPRPRHVRLHRHPRRGLPVHGPGVDPRPGAQVHAHRTHDLRRLDRPADPRHRRGEHAPDRTRRVRHPQLGESTRDLHRLPDDRGGDPVRRDLGRPRDPRPGRLGDARRVRKRLLGCHVGVRRRRQERPRVWDDVRGCHPSAGGSGHQRDHAPRAPRRPGVEAELDRHPRCDVRGVSDDRPVRGDVRRAGDPRPRHVRLHRHPRRGLPVHGPGVDPRPGAQVHAHRTHDLRRLDRPADPRHRRRGHAPDRTRRVRHPQLGESTRDLHRLPDDRGGDLSTACRPRR